MDVPYESCPVALAALIAICLLDPAASHTQNSPSTAGEAARRGLVRIPAGAFAMGEGLSARRVNLDTYWIDKREVTVAEYRRCVEAGACSEPEAGEGKGKWEAYYNWGKPGREKHPINGVTWSQARAYCQWTGGRLPTEAEWERAARGRDGRRYPWGDTPPGEEAGDLGNFADETAGEVFSEWTVIEGYRDGHAGTAPAGSFPGGASPYGVLDMAGNVWEWTADRYGEGGGEPASWRVLRGGSWYNTASGLRATYRGKRPPDKASDGVGFRCVRASPEV